MLEFGGGVEDRLIQPREDLFPFPAVIGGMSAGEDHIDALRSLSQLRTVRGVGPDMRGSGTGCRCPLRHALPDRQPEARWRCAR